MSLFAPPKQATQRRIFIETLGCQMNLSDSELMAGALAKDGYVATSDPENADVLIINTCQIRGSAEDKAYSKMGRWGKLKKSRPDIKIVMAGCASQQAKGEVFKRAPYVDIVLGTQNIHEITKLVNQAFAGEKHQLAADRQKPRSTWDYMTDIAPRRESDLLAWVTIIEGCDYFCTYCVVPYTRGRQISRAPESIIDEVKKLADVGFKEVTLLGQTVDSYGKDFTDRQYGLANLLEALNDVSGLERIRFMTSHPLDLNDAIIEAVAALPKVCEYIHIPMQAGDDAVLAAMRRGYTAGQYYELIDKIFDRVPGVSISGDYIVGFPGETEVQFQNTFDSIARSRVHQANVAAYSARKQTPAGLWETRPDMPQAAQYPPVPEDVKFERMKLLNEEVKRQSLVENLPYVGQHVEVLVEGPSRRRADRLTGRTRNNKIVNFEAPAYADIAAADEALHGQLVHIPITEATPWCLIGQL